MKMMKLLLVSLTICFQSVFAQVAYYDAIELETYLFETSSGVTGFKTKDTSIVERWAGILASYDAKLKNKDSIVLSDVKSSFEINPFLKNFVQSAKTLSNEKVDIAKSAQGFFAAAGGLNVTTFTEGLANFLVERAKEELNAAFFRKFKEELESEEYTDFRILFPETFRVLQVIDREFYNYAPYLISLREGFKKDLDSLLDNIYVLINHRNYEKYFNDHPELKEIFNNAFSIINDLVNGSHPGDILNKIADTGFKFVDENFNNGIKLLNVFSNSLRSKDPDKYWISQDSLRLLTNNRLIIYMGLIYQQIASSNDSVKNYIKDLAPMNFDEISEVGDEYYKFISGFVQKATAIDVHIRDIKNIKPADLESRDYVLYFSTAFDLFEYTLRIKELPNFKFNFDSGVKKAVGISRLAGDIYGVLKSGKYTTAIFNSTILLDSLLSDKFKHKNQILKYGSFMATVASAQNADEVTAVIEAFALPPGSASIKRQTKTNISLNSYVGVTGGAEYLEGTGSLNAVSAIYAPLGIAFSFGLYSGNLPTDGYDEFGAFTVYLSLIDIGAVTAYRFNDPESETLPEIKFENIFSPGINIVYGFANSPISIGIGGQLGPSLRKISTESAEIRSGVNYRLHAFLAVDIPILNFYSNPR